MGRERNAATKLSWLSIASFLIFFFIIPGLVGTSHAGAPPQLVTGRGFSLAIQKDGSLWSWGSNVYGQLGNGNTVDAHIPGQVGSGMDWQEVFAGRDHVMAIRTDGTLWAWGDNSRGQLGNGTTTNSSTPIQVGTDSDWRTVGGSWHTLALKTDGTLWAWGRNSSGQLGDGTTVDSYVPIQVGTDTDWAAIEGGSAHSLAVKDNGTLWSWGRNSSGQLGDGTNTDSPFPMQVGSDSNWVRVEAARIRSMAIKSDGTLWAWGDNSFGQIGDGTTTDSNIPVQVGEDNTWTEFSAGPSSSMALKNDGTIWAWGNNSSGQLGDGTTTDSYIPIQVGTDTDWIGSAGGSHNLAVKTDNSVWGWGANSNGQVGDGTTVNRLFPVPIYFDDFCPDDPLKSRPGVCGCGIPEDADGNDVIDCTGAYTVLQLTDNAYDDMYRTSASHYVINSNGQVAWHGSTEVTDDEIFTYDGMSVQQITDNSYYDTAPVLAENGAIAWTAAPDDDGSGSNTFFEIMVDTGGGPVQFTDNQIRDSRPLMNNTGQLLWQQNDTVSGTYWKLLFYNGAAIMQLDDSPPTSPPPLVFQHNLNDNGQAVWHKHDGTDFEIVFFDGVTSQTLTDNVFDDATPDLDGAGNVVWAGSDGTDYEIFLYDGGSITQLTDNAFDDVSPVISNGSVTWQGWDGTDYEIFLYNGVITQLTDNLFDDVNPKINSSGQVVWQGWDGIDYEIYLHDGVGVTQLTNNDFDDQVPMINAYDWVVWYGWDGNDNEIFMARPAAPVPNGGDANGDGIQDIQQNNVVSMQSIVTGDYVVTDSATAGGGAEIVNVSVNSEEFYGGDPDFDLPFGVVKFDVVGLSVGGSETVRVYFYGVGDLTGYVYRKFDPLTSSWYTLPGVTFGTEIIGSESVAYADLYLIDGTIGDWDLIADGVIRDPGGLALPSGPICTADPAMFGVQTYATIQSAYDAIGSGNAGIIKIQTEEIGETLYFDWDIAVTLKGGYDCYFNEPPTGQTTISAPGTTTLIISSGMVIVDNIILR